MPSLPNNVLMWRGVVLLRVCMKNGLLMLSVLCYGVPQRCISSTIFCYLLAIFHYISLSFAIFNYLSLSFAFTFFTLAVTCLFKIQLNVSAYILNSDQCPLLCQSPHFVVLSSKHELFCSSIYHFMHSIKENGTCCVTINLKPKEVIHSGKKTIL